DSSRHAGLAKHVDDRDANTRAGDRTLTSPATSPRPWSLCNDLAPAKQGTKGQVISMNHETARRQLIAPQTPSLVAEGVCGEKQCSLGWASPLAVWGITSSPRPAYPTTTRTPRFHISSMIRPFSPVLQPPSSPGLRPQPAGT